MSLKNRPEAPRPPLETPEAEARRLEEELKLSAGQLVLEVSDRAIVLMVADSGELVKRSGAALSFGFLERYTYAGKVEMCRYGSTRRYFDAVDIYAQRLRGRHNFTAGNGPRLLKVGNDSVLDLIYDEEFRWWHPLLVEVGGDYTQTAQSRATRGNIINTATELIIAYENVFEGRGGAFPG